MYIKIKNLSNNGMCDYKGLDINLIESGTQLYPSAENTAYFSYNGEIINNPDIIQITENEYILAKEIDAKNRPITLEDKVAQLELSNANMEYILMMGGLI
ncbi:hypothetical protein [Clostridium sp.]|uniref:hypothetical protein n=1 Tax=Clostridium sp. TaxID=1506 RepID=UPI002FCB1BA3